jgi:transcriptional regulator with XRE-family HTH domain
VQFFTFFVNLHRPVKMPRKNPISAEENAICERLRRFRTMMRLSQAEFAARAGLDHRVYASYEYARSRLTYRSAWKILNGFRLLNPRWLAEGAGIPFEVYFALYPTPQGMSVRAPFSEVYRELIKAPFSRAQSIWSVGTELPLREIVLGSDTQSRLAARDILSEIIFDWICAQPDSTFSQFINALFLAGAELLNKFPPDRGEARLARFVELLRSDAKLHIIERSLLSEKYPLTDVTVSAKSNSVKSEMANLLDRLKRATSQRGDKSKLAKVLGVPLANVSQWLSGEREPGGETTLKLLRWVEQQER